MPDIVTVTTEDGCVLDAAYWPAQGAPPARADACLLLHGATGHAFRGLQRTLGEGLSLRGTAVLALNTRGHDIVARIMGPSGPVLGGTAFEDLDEAPLDVRAGFEWLRSRGHERVVIAGHSLGAVKCIFTQATAPLDGLAGLIAISPPRLAYQAQVDAATGELFLATLESARELVDSGRGDAVIQAEVPLPSLFGAAQYVKKYGPEDRYDIGAYFPRITTPSLLVLGTKEVQEMVSIAATAAVVDDIDAVHPALTTQLVDGADHQYTDRLGALLKVVAGWLEGAG
jgi:pimeloyl-ACP methyl ester carboxylesterase